MNNRHPIDARILASDNKQDWISGQGSERSYGEGMADSKLKIPAAKRGTARNMNTVAKLVAMTSTQ